MSKLICLSLGNMWRWLKTENRAELIEHVKGLDIDGIELDYSGKEPSSLKLTSEQEEYLKSLKYVSIHVTAESLKGCSEEDIIRRLDYVVGIAKKTNASDIVIHPEALPSPDILSKYDVKFLTENLDRNTGYGLEKLKKVFEDYPDLGLCLDVCHSFTWDGEETKKLVDEFKDKISQVHLSALEGDKQHRPLLNSSSDMIESIEPIKSLDVPIVIEEDFEDGDFDGLKKEIEFVKGILNR